MIAPDLLDIGIRGRFALGITTIMEVQLYPGFSDFSDLGGMGAKGRLL